jgi:hypothetical protein
LPGNDGDRHPVVRNERVQDADRDHRDNEEQLGPKPHFK